MEAKATKPTLKTDEVVGTAAESSETGIALLADYDRAKTALDAADAAELFVLYEKAIRDRNEFENAMSVAVSHYVGKKDEPRYMPNNDNAIAAMERVALAALDLAKQVALGKPTK